jgi:hypothetical protein
MKVSALNQAANSLQNIIKQLDQAADYIEVLEAHLNRANQRLEFYEEHFGTYEDVQAQALAPSPDAFDFTPSDIEELSAQDTQELTDAQKHAAYQLQLEAEQHASQEDTYKPSKY